MFQLSASSALLFHPQAMRQKWAEFLTLSHGQSPRAYLPQAMEEGPYPLTKYSTSLGDTYLRYARARVCPSSLTLDTGVNWSQGNTQKHTLSGSLKCIRNIEWKSLRQRYYTSCTPWAGVPLGLSGSTLLVHLLTNKGVSNAF